jgi:hypothetical protein
MSAGDISPPQAADAPRFRVNWIAGPWTDLPWFIGGALCGYALFAMHAVLAWNMELVWLVWYVLLDIPHFFGTYVRTYFDPVERGRRPLLLYGSLAFPLIGPALLGIGYLIWAFGPAWLQPYHRLPFDGLLVFVMLWAYWHVVRQHYGIMALYKRKNEDTSAWDWWADNALLYVGLLVPLLVIAMRHPEARLHLRLPTEMTVYEQIALAGGAALVFVCAAWFATRQVALWRSGEPINLPKVLFLLAVVPLHLFVGWHPATLTTGLFAFGAFVTIFHDVQYHAIVWHAQQVKLSRSIDTDQHGLSAWVSRNFLIYMGCAVAMGIVAWFIGCSLGIRPGCYPIIEPWDHKLFGNVWLWHLITGAVLGGIMHHYFVDQFIWRPSKDEQVRRDLTETATAAGAGPAVAEGVMPPADRVREVPSAS